MSWPGSKEWGSPEASQADFPPWQVLGFHPFSALVPVSLGPCWMWAPDMQPGRTRRGLYGAVGLPQREKGFVSGNKTLLGIGSQPHGQGNFPPLGVFLGAWSVSPASSRGWKWRREPSIGVLYAYCVRTPFIGWGDSMTTGVRGPRSG